MIIKTDTGTVIPDLTHTIPDMGVQAIMTLVGVAPDHCIDLHVIAPPTTEAQVCTATTMMHHTTDLHPTDIFPGMIADPNNTNPTDNITNQHKDLPQVLKTTSWDHKDRRNKQVTIDNPPSKYYSSDDQDSDSEDDLN